MVVCYAWKAGYPFLSRVLMFDIGFFELIIIMGIAVVVVGPKNLPRLARSIGRGWGEFVSTFEGLKQEIMDEADNLKEDVNIDQLEQDISAATKVEVDVNLEADKPVDPK
tara:strand:+ start:5542 stop:5871 length:330 start_codon:yes stop_codon:yes gene_type:complete